VIPVYAQRPDAPLPNGDTHAASAGNHELDPTAACERFPLVRGLACWTRAQQLSQKTILDPSVPIRPCKKYQPEFPEPILEQEFQG